MAGRVLDRTFSLYFTFSFHFKGGEGERYREYSSSREVPASQDPGPSKLCVLLFYLACVLSSKRAKTKWWQL